MTFGKLTFSELYILFFVGEDLKIKIIVFYHAEVFKFTADMLIFNLKHIIKMCRALLIPKQLHSENYSELFSNYSSQMRIFYRFYWLCITYNFPKNWDIV